MFKQFRVSGVLVETVDLLTRLDLRKGLILGTLHSRPQTLMFT